MSINIIDHSETLAGLQISALSTTVIQQDAGSPAGQPVVVQDDSLSLGVGSTVIVQHNATLVMDGPAQVGLLSQIEIGDSGTVVIGSPLSIDLLAGMQFIGSDATLAVMPSAEHSLLSGSSSGQISGFAATDTIDLQGVTGVDHVAWTQNLLQSLTGTGTLTLYNSTDHSIGKISLSGSYQTDNFHAAPVAGGTDITYVPSAAVHLASSHG
jgi:hypothetical protein